MRQYLLTFYVFSFLSFLSFLSKSIIIHSYINNCLKIKFGGCINRVQKVFLAPSREESLTSNCLGYGPTVGPKFVLHRFNFVHLLYFVLSD